MTAYSPIVISSDMKLQTHDKQIAGSGILVARRFDTQLGSASTPGIETDT